jgi:hypothetical protein
MAKLLFIDNCLVRTICLQTLERGKAIPVTGREGPYGCKTLKVPHFLDNRLTDGRKVVSLTHRPPLTPRKISVIIMPATEDGYFVDS